MRRHEGRSQLFTLRVWPENIGEGLVEWRGKVQRAADGETLYFRDWSNLRTFILESVDAEDVLTNKQNQPQAESDVHPGQVNS